jgi:hypothetical protein
VRSVHLVLGFSLLMLALAGCGSKPKAGDPPTQASQAASDRSVSAIEMVEHPSFRLWSKFPVGTTVTQRTTTDSPKTPGMTITTIIYTLTNKSSDSITIETQATTMYHGQPTMKNPPAIIRTPSKIPLPNGIRREDWGKPAGKTETEDLMQAAGKQYRTRKLESKGNTDAGELFQVVWTSDEMPGGLVKSVSLVPKVEETTTIEVTHVFVPET